MYIYYNYYITILLMLKKTIKECITLIFKNRTCHKTSCYMIVNMDELFKIKNLLKNHLDRNLNLVW